MIYDTNRHQKHKINNLKSKIERKLRFPVLELWIHDAMWMARIFTPAGGETGTVSDLLKKYPHKRG